MFTKISIFIILTKIMYPHFIKFIIVSMVWLLLTAVFYLTICKKISQKKLFCIAFFSVPIFFIGGFLFFKFGANYFFGGGVQKVIVWFMWLWVMTIIPFFIFIIFYWFDLLLKFIFKKDLKIKYFVGLSLNLIFLIAYLQGTYNCNELEIRSLTIEIENLPQEFDGLKIAVLGDTHLGNFAKYKKYFNQIGNAINSHNVDLLLFTGDLVNTMPKEGVPFIPFFNSLNVKYGKYAVMGNHDFCKYFDWSDEIVKETMIYNTKKMYNSCGFSLLENEYVLLEKDTLSKICIVGADETGNLQETFKDCPSEVFKILLIHNVKDSEIQIARNKDIGLTISGHTHALQCAYNILGKKISPAQLLFKHWDGLYNIENKYLFVTRGVGYAGIPVRMGLKPEVSILELRNKNKNLRILKNKISVKIKITP